MLVFSKHSSSLYGAVVARCYLKKFHFAATNLFLSLVIDRYKSASADFESWALYCLAQAAKKLFFEQHKPAISCTEEIF